MSKKTSPSARRKKMSDIAKLAGVSESTVSRALAGSTLINEATRERVTQIAKEQNYAINRQAQNLRTQTSKTISVIIPIDHDPKQHVSDPFFLELLGAIADALTEQGYDLLLSRVHTKEWRAKVDSQSYSDGLVIIGQSTIHDEINQFVETHSIATVVWGAKMEQQSYVSVGTDNFAGGRLATQHLLGQGAQRIVFLGDPNLPEVNQRFEGYTEALQQSGVAFDSSLLFPCGFSAESGETALDDLLASAIEFDGVFAASDVLASLVLRRLQAKGISVPSQVSVVGYDDISIAPHLTPPLTTVSQCIRDSGRVLVENLLAQIAEKSVSSVVLPPQLKQRHSTLS